MKRREFLKFAPAAVGLAVSAPATAGQSSSAREVRLPSVAYTPAEYPIRPQPYFAVKLTDQFWRPKVDINASVTIPFEVGKLSDMEDGFRGNVLEAAMLSLKTHANPDLEARVEARVAQLGKPRGGQSKDWLHALTISPDGKWLAAGDMAGAVQVWTLG